MSDNMRAGVGQSAGVFGLGGSVRSEELGQREGVAVYWAAEKLFQAPVVDELCRSSIEVRENDVRTAIC